MILALFLLLLVLSIYLFASGKEAQSIILLTFFITDGFQIFPEELSSVKYADFVLIYIITVSGILFFKDSSFFKLNDTLSKIIALLLVYFTIELIVTIISEKENLDLAFKVYRKYCVIAIYFILRTLNHSKIEFIFKYLFALTTVTLLIYLAQILLETQLLTGTIDSSSTGAKEERYRNIPYLLDFGLIYSFYAPKLKVIRYPLIILFLIGLVAPLNRGPIISFTAVMILYLLIQGNVGTIIKYAIFTVLVGMLSWPILARRFSKENTGSDIKSSLQLRSYKNFNVTGGGNFEFRILLLRERIDYLTYHPEYLLTGIGMRHEDSPHTLNQFNFYLGANKVQKGSDKKVVQQIETSDLVWATMIFRFGLVGVAIYLILYSHLLIFFFKKRQIYVGVIGLLIVSIYLFNSFGTDILTRTVSFFIIFLVYTYTSKTKNFTLLTRNEQ